MRNQKLYDAMCVVFKEKPKVINNGEAAILSLPPPIVSFVPCITPLSTSHISGGEQYAVNCPFCGDTRHRLYVSHMWNQIIETSNHVKYHCSKHLIRCFNEDCQRKEENFNQLCERLIHVMKNPQVIRLADVQTVELQTNLTTIKNQVPYPEQAMSLRDPRVPHHVLQYLENRGFDIDYVASWGVQVAWIPYPIQGEEIPMKYPILIVPVYQYGHYWFWQGRLVPVDGTEHGDLERRATGEFYSKYYIPRGAKKNWALYNLDNAEKFSEVAIVEGVTDVWRIGDNAVATFGKQLSPAQKKTLRDRFRGKRLVFVPDMNDPQTVAIAEAQRIELLSSGSFSAVEISCIESGKDPGSLRIPQGQIWNYLNKHIISQGRLTGIPFGDQAFL